MAVVCRAFEGAFLMLLQSGQIVIQFKQEFMPCYQKAKELGGDERKI